jgi:uncharacterized protein
MLLNKQPKAMTKKIQELDGRIFYYSFLAGAKRLMEHQKELDKINVFPVADADTGTNLAATIRAVIEKVKPEKSFKNTIDAIARESLIGARGNSGIIFAQFFQGISNETKTETRIDVHRFADTIKHSVKYIYEAVANPVEGTMLTVIREWAEFVHTNKERTRDFGTLVSDSLETAQKSLAETTGKLKVLAKSKVVDAGAKGFVVFLEGIHELLKTSNIRNLYHSDHLVEIPDEPLPVSHENFNFRFCTEAIIQDLKTDKHFLKEVMEKSGDSVVIAGSDKTLHVHFHTNDPADFFHKIRNAGSLGYQKADDMLRQYETAHKRKFRIALVTDSTCDLSQEIIDQYQINIVPINLIFDKNNYLDKLTINTSQFYDLIEESNIWPTTSQPSRPVFEGLYKQLLSHYDSVIALHLTGQFSGTFQTSAKAAAQVSRQFEKPVTVLDSKTLSGSLGLLVYRAAQAIEEGKSHNEIVQSIETWRKKSKIFVSVKSLDYFIRGGRVSPLKGKAAKFLNLKPIVSIDNEGKSLLLDKAFSLKGNMKLVMKNIKKLAAVDQVRDYQLLHTHNPEGIEWFKNEMVMLTGKQPLATLDISPVIGLNAGPGAVAVSVMIE